VDISSAVETSTPPLAVKASVQRASSAAITAPSFCAVAMCPLS
jgi:hypothetical protein